MPVVRIPGPVFERLQTFATPLIDTPATVIEKLLNFYEAHQDRNQRAATRPARSTATSPRATSQSSRTSLRDRFRTHLDAIVPKLGARVGDWSQGRSIVEITAGERAIRLYFKTRSDSEGFWGVNTNRVEALQAGAVPWFLALLVGPGETSYLLKGQDVVRAINSKRWSRAQDGEYKVHEKQKDLANFARFDRFSDLIDDLVSNA